MDSASRALGLSLEAQQLQSLCWLQDELLKWSQRINLTAIRSPEEVLEKHLLDSLTLVPELGGVQSLLDLGAGAGFPGLPVAIAQGHLKVTMVDSVAKKVGFIKHAIAQLTLAPRVTALAARAEGHPEREGIPRAQAVVSRAFRELPQWLALAPRYLEPGGKLLAMVASFDEAQVRSLGVEQGLVLEASRSFKLPLSGADRAVLTFRPV